MKVRTKIKATDALKYLNSKGLRSNCPNCTIGQIELMEDDEGFANEILMPNREKETAVPLLWTRCNNCSSVQLFLRVDIAAWLERNGE